MISACITDELRSASKFKVAASSSTFLLRVPTQLQRLQRVSGYLRPRNLGFIDGTATDGYWSMHKSHSDSRYLCTQLLLVFIVRILNAAGNSFTSFLDHSIMFDGIIQNYTTY